MKKKILACVLCLAVFISVITPSLGWFAELFNLSNFPSFSASTEGAYFESGDGSETYPYIISSPIHLYNLAWLQYIGYFNLGEINNGRAQSYFELKNNIDMEKLAIPPIGTTEYPFLGNFKGNGYIISNAVTGNAKTPLTQRPTHSQFKVNDLLSEYGGNEAEAGAVIGFFGVVGDYNNAIAAVNGKSNEKVAEGKISVTSFGINNYSLQNTSNATTIGFVAGYVNATVSNVLVGNCTLSTGSGVVGVVASGTVSEHTLIGYCTEAYEKTVNDTVFSIYDPRVDNTLKDINGAGGQDSNWGGSVAMDAMFKNLEAVRGTNENPGTGVGIGDYAYKATKVVSADGKSFYAVDRDTINTGFMYTNSAESGLAEKAKYSIVYTYGSDNLDEFVWLAGGAMVTTITCNINTNEADKVTGHYIKYGDSYLNVEIGGGEPSFVLGNDQATASRWVVDNGNLFALTEGCKLYVNVDESQNISFHYNETASGTWSYDEGEGDTPSKGLCYTVGSTEYYLKLLEGHWVLRQAEDASAYFVIKSGDNYLSLSGEILVGPNLQIAKNYAPSDPNDTKITKWYTSYNPEGYFNIYTEINETPYALLYLDPNLLVDSGAMNAGIPWSFMGEHLYLTGFGYLTLNGTSWGFSSNAPNTPVWQSVAVSESGVSWTKGENESLYDITFSPSSPNTDSSAYNFELGVANKWDATYIPLQMNDDHSPTSLNTGYLTSGMYNHLTHDMTNGPTPPVDNTGDVRLSNFYRQNIEKKENQADKDFVHAYINGKFVEVEVDSNNDNLVKYSESVQAYKKLLESDRLYGLQFINGKISKDSLITIPNATINGLVNNGTITVPADCIDFTLRNEGYINFFAGTYYPGTNCFFSLHEIVRYTDEVEATAAGKKVGDIKEIKEIKKIYQVNGQSSYVYTYDDSTAAPLNSTLVFDTGWLTDPNGMLTDPIIAEPEHTNGFTSADIQEFKGATYYFEIPVNAGEYALGSVEGKVGATLLYLDIGASLQDATNQEIDRTVIYEMFTEDVQDFTYADGVGIMDSAYEAVTTPNFSMTLAQGYGTNITLSRTDNNTGNKVVTVSSTAATATLNSKGGFDVTVGDNVTLNSTAGAQTITTKRVTYVDNNVTAGTTIITVITWRDADGDGAVDVSDGASEITYTITGTDGTLSSIGTTGTTTTVQLSHHSAADTINWADTSIWSNLTTTVLKYQYAPASGVTVKNDPVFTLATDGTAKGTYAVTVTATGATTVTVTENTAGTTATSVAVTGGDNVTVSSGTS